MINSKCLVRWSGEEVKSLNAYRYPIAVFLRHSITKLIFKTYNNQIIIKFTLKLSQK